MLPTGAEGNATHVWNYTIEAHARFHIVWQLSNNFSIYSLCMLFMWGHLDKLFNHDEIPTLLTKIRLSAMILVLEPLCFIFAGAFRNSYGGTYFPANVPEYDVKILDVPVALIVFMILCFVEIMVLYRSHAKLKVGV